MSSAGLTNPVQIRGTLLARNSVLNFIGHAVPLLVGVATIPYIIRGLGTERFGILALAWVVVGYFSVFNLGLGQATTKFVAELLGKGETHRLPPLVWTSFILHALFGTIAGLVLAAVTPVLVERLFNLPPRLIDEAGAMFLILAVTLPILFVAGVFRGVLGAQQRFDLLNAIQIPSTSLNFLIPATGVMFGFGLPRIVLLLLIARLATALAYFVLCLRIVPSLKQTFSFDLRLLRPLLSYGGWLTISGVVAPVLIYLDRFLIGALISLGAVTYYTAPSEVVFRLAIFPGSLMGVLFPAFSTLAGSGQHARVQNIFGRSVRYILLFMGPVVLFFFFYAGEILELWLGTEFAQQSTLVLQILSVWVLVSSLLWVPHTLLQAVGRPDIPAKFQLLELLPYVALAWFFIGKFGIAGAALAWTLRTAFHAVLLFGACAWLRIASARTWLENGVLSSIVALAFLAGAVGAVSLWDPPWMIQTTLTAAFFLGFVGVVWQSALDSTEKGSLRLMLSQLGGARAEREDPGVMLARIAVVHPRLGIGGSEARALWTLEALKDDYSVSLITDGDVDLPRLNKCYGTNLERTDFSILRVPLPIGLRTTTQFAALRGHLTQRFCQREAPRFDLMISTYNPCDFGVRGIQCIADFSFDEVLRPVFDRVSQGWKAYRYRDSLLRRAYLKLCNNVFRSNPEGWKKNLTLANSHWSAKLMRQRYGLEARILYPPVADGFPSIPYSERENGFVCIGRLVPGKHMDIVIKILSRVRRRGHDIHLHIIGGPADSQYASALKKLGRTHREWVFLEGVVFGERKKELIAKHRFGISGRTDEAFGIAVAEMVKGGCIVFTPNGGGQVEIVDHPDLVYSDVDDAVLKIERVLESASMQEGLRRHLSRAAQRFSVENFQRGIRDAVSRFLGEEKVQQGMTESVSSCKDNSTVVEPCGF